MNITNIMSQFGEYLYYRLPKVYRDYDVDIERVVNGELKVFKTLQEYLYSFAEGGFQPMLEDLEAVINLVDPWKCPSEFLPLLLRHFGLDFIEDIPERFQRRLLQNIITLYKKKGTIPAVVFLARELSGFDCHVEETERGDVEFALVKLDAYDNEDAELLLAQSVIQRYIHLFLPSNVRAEVIVTYGSTEGIHFNSLAEYDEEFDHVKYTVTETQDELIKIVEGGDCVETHTIEGVNDSMFPTVDGSMVRYGFWIDEFDALEQTKDTLIDTIRSVNGVWDETFTVFPFDITSLTNLLEEGDFVYTNGICCEDTFISAKYADSDGDGTIEFSYPSETGRATVTKLAGSSGGYAVMPMVKVATDIAKGEWLRFSYGGKYYYWRADRDLKACSAYPTTFVLYANCGTVKIYSAYEKVVINELSDLTMNSGYNSFNVPTGLALVTTTSAIKKVNCTISSAGYYNNGSTGYTYARMNTSSVDIARKGITTVEAMRDWLKDNPITLYAPATRNSYFGHYMEKYLETETVPASFRSFTMSIPTDTTVAFSYAMNSFMRSTRIAIQDKYGAEHVVRIPVELWSLNGKTNYISKSGGKYFMHYWVDIIPDDWIYDPDQGSGFGGGTYYSSRGLFRFYQPKYGDNPYLPVDVSSNQNFACDIAPFIDDTLNYEGKTDIYDSRHFKFRNVSRIYSNGKTWYCYGISCYNGFPLARPAFIGVESTPELKAQWYQLNKERWERFYEGTDLIPHFYYVRTEERVEEILDEEVINKLNLLPIPDNYAKIYSKDIPFSEIEVSVESKMYY